MITITVPITQDLEDFIKEEVAQGVSESKAHLVRYALARLREERTLARLHEAEDDIKHGRIYKGNLRTILKKVA